MRTAASFDDSWIGEPNSGCWLWTKGVAQSKTHEYGFIRVKGKSYRAHRFSWELHYGPIPDGLAILHKCDTPLCVNPSHLTLGTIADNNADMMAKGRQRSLAGEAHCFAKLTEEDVQFIRASKLRDAELALKCGVTKTTIYAVRRGRTWKHLIKTAA